MKKFLGVIFIAAGVGILAGIGFFLWKNLRGIGPAILPPKEDIVEVINTTGMPLKLPPGFSIEIFAKGLGKPRVLSQAPGGGLLVSIPAEGKVMLVKDTNEDGSADEMKTILQDLNRPHGLAFSPGGFVLCNGACEYGAELFVAETDKIVRYHYWYGNEANQDKIKVEKKEKIIDLPGGGNHFTRTIGFGPDDRLYVSIGSSCDTCYERDNRRAKIFSMKKDGSDFKEFASGLRNAVFFTWSYVDGRMFATEMGRDLLGDDLPPDEINIIQEGKNYGWPECYGKNVHDIVFSQSRVDICPSRESSYIDIQAHSAPLGLAFVPEEGWPEEYWYDLLVAYHGSWNRSKPTGYKISRMKLDAKGNFEGEEDFITGWLTEDDEALGRPVDILVQPGGTMYISDDKAGVIYKVSYRGENGGKPIRVENPRQNKVIYSPLFIRGEARGTWFFEASFPVRLLDSSGREIAVSHAEAKSDWMTTNFVPFEAKLEFQKPATEAGTLILEKDNPSGLPEHADEIRIPVRFY